MSRKRKDELDVVDALNELEKILNKEFDVTFHYGKRKRIKRIDL